MNKKEKAVKAAYARAWRAKNRTRAREIARKGQRAWYSRKINGQYQKSPEERIEYSLRTYAYHRTKGNNNE